jgi:hypothetical protein
MFLFLPWNSNLFAQIGNIFLPVYQDWFTLGHFFLTSEKTFLTALLEKWNSDQKTFSEKNFRRSNSRSTSKRKRIKTFQFQFSPQKQVSWMPATLWWKILYKSTSDVITFISPPFGKRSWIIIREIKFVVYMEKDKKSKEVESLKNNIGWFQVVQELP